MTLADERNLVKAFVAGRAALRSRRRLTSPPDLRCFASSSSTSASQYPAVKANDRVQPARRAGRDPRRARRERRRQVDADEDHLRRRPARRGRDPLERRARRRSRRRPRRATLGISMVYQHFSLFDTLTAAENVWLGLDKSLSLAEVTRAHHARSRGSLRPRRRSAAAGAHALGRREAARRDRARADDAPKLPDPRRADLGADAAGGADAVRHAAQARRRGLLDPLHLATSSTRSVRCATTAPVLRGGKVTGEVDPTQGDQRQPVAPDDRRRAAAAAAPRAAAGRGRARGARPDARQGRPVRHRARRTISFDVRAGEIVGIAGVSGNGQQELMAAISGEDRARAAGSIRLFGSDIARASPRTRRDARPALRARRSGSAAARCRRSRWRRTRC